MNAVTNPSNSYASKVSQTAWKNPYCDLVKKTIQNQFYKNNGYVCNIPVKIIDDSPVSGEMLISDDNITVAVVICSKSASPVQAYITRSTYENTTKIKHKLQSVCDVYPEQYVGISVTRKNETHYGFYYIRDFSKYEESSDQTYARANLARLVAGKENFLSDMSIEIDSDWQPKHSNINIVESAKRVFNALKHKRTDIAHSTSALYVEHIRSIFKDRQDAVNNNTDKFRHLYTTCALDDYMHPQNVGQYASASAYDAFHFLADIARKFMRTKAIDDIRKLYCILSGEINESFDDGTAVPELKFALVYSDTLHIPDAEEQTFSVLAEAYVYPKQTENQLEQLKNELYKSGNRYMTNSLWPKDVESVLELFAIKQLNI